MRVACPSCGAEYEVPEALLAAGPRTLRCARCGHQFPAALPAPSAKPAGPPGAPRGGPAGAPAAEPPAEPGGTPAGAPPAEALAAPEGPGPGPAPRPLVVDTDRPPPTRGLTRHSPMDALPRPGEEEEAEAAPARPVPLAAAWILSLALLGAVAWAGLHWRAEIMEAWPPAARLYHALGLG